MASSGQISRASKANGVLLIKLSQTAAGPAKRGGDDINIKSGLLKNSPMMNAENMKLK
jgi:hypothetical protein